MNRVEVVTKNDDDEMWDLASQVVERQITEDNEIRWVIETASSPEEIEQTVPSMVSVKLA